MRFLVLVFAMMLISSVIVTSKSVARSSEKQEEFPLNMNEPPFWMSSYDEFHNLRKDQREFYTKELLKEFKKVPALSNITVAKMTEASDWYEGWNEIRRKLYVACLEQSLQKTCDEFADLRVQTLNMYANQNEKNLKNPEKSANKDSKPSDLKAKDSKPAALGVKPPVGKEEDPE